MPKAKTKKPAKKKDNIPRCPKCGSEPCGVHESVYVTALITFDDDGIAEFAGETDICWDTQEAVLKDECLQLVCSNRMCSETYKAPKDFEVQ